MEPADIYPCKMSVAEARKILPKLTYERAVAGDIATKIRGRKLNPLQAQAALVLAWNDLLARTEFSLDDYNREGIPLLEEQD